MAAEPPARGATLEVTPLELGPRGEAVAVLPDGPVVSVPGGIPGEQLRVSVLARRHGIVHARALEVVVASPDRVVPPCPEVAGGCGACQWQHLALPAQRSAKRERIAEALTGVAGDDPPLRPTVELPAAAFRTTLDAAVTNGRAGFRRYRSHRVVAVDGCVVAHPLLVDLLVDGRYGDASEVLLRCGARTGERLAHPAPHGARITVPDDVRTDHLHEVAAGREWRVSARSFFQSRADGIDALAALVGDAADALGVPGRALDLYSGVGVFAGVLAERGWSVTAVESNGSAVDDARANLRDLDVTVVRADVTRWKARAADLVVADPSRAGLDRRGVDVVAASGARRVVLVSCDVASFGRDASMLARKGYALTHATPVDLFPHTFHVEVVSVFDR